MKKVMTVLGTRPEIIRLSRIIPLLDEHCRHVLVHTGQNYDDRLNRLFFEELAVREPDHYLNVRSESFGGQIGQVLERGQKILEQEQPERLLVLGDTNSALLAFVAKRLGIAVYHMEAGNRCFDDRVPEEVNRRVIDHSSDVLMPYTRNSKENLIAEGIALSRIFVTGNPINEVLNYYRDAIAASTVMQQLKLSKNGYFLVTAHREENVDVPHRLAALIEGLTRLSRDYGFPVIFSTHPRTRKRLEAAGLLGPESNIHFAEPFGLFDFVHLQSHAFCVLTDSGTVQEECCLLKRPNVTVRDATERPETLTCGSNMLCAMDADIILRAVNIAVETGGDWQPPEEYLAENVSRTVLKIVLGG